MVPWYDQEEWGHVRDLVLARDPGAVVMMQTWQSRVDRLAAGVETTLALLSSHVSQPHTCLSLATSVNRFLNHVSHIGMKMFSVTKLHDAARKLSVPEWIVQLRHETTHGHMPGLTMLRAALEFALTWLDTNYWTHS